MNICQLIPESQQKEALALIRKMSQAELLEPYHAQRLTKTGQHIEVWIAATTLVNHIGNIYAISTTERLAKGHDHA
jgi:two-component system CheB/CheR fusion protein